MHVRLIGYWRNGDEEPWPDPRALIDESWSDPERERVARYLERGSEAIAYLGFSSCRLCDRQNGAAEFTDGVFLWPEGLSHYVREHSVKLPEEVLAHIERRSDEVESLDVDPAWAAAYAHRVFLPEGALENFEANFGELPEDVRAYLLHSDEVETLVIDRDWWAQVTSA